MKKPWDREAVRVLPAKIDLDKHPWCREAALLHVRGSGALHWETREKPPEADPYESAYCLTLRGTPLLSWQAAVCETSESLLCAGWGLDGADCPELEELRETLNGGFPGLQEAVPALSPLLALLPEGLYVLAEGDVYPAQGGGRFFWDVPDRLDMASATAMACLNDDDYDYGSAHLPPVFLYPSQKRSRLDGKRVEYYKKRFQEPGPPPHGIALHVTEGVSLLLDGHHKAAAAALLGRALPCLTILRLEHYLLRPVTTRRGSPVVPRRYEEYAGCFGPLTVPVGDMGPRPPKEPWRFARGSGPLPAGRLDDGPLPEALLEAGRRYPTAEGYALVSAAEIGYPTDRDLRTWLADVGHHRPELRAALVLLRSRNDPRLKDAALRCAGVEDVHCSLKEEAFGILAEMKGEPEAEAFFVDFFVSLEDPSQFRSGRLENLVNIAHSFWD